MEDLFYTCDHFPEVGKKYVDEALSLSYVERLTPSLFIGGLAQTFADTEFYKNLSTSLPCSSPLYVKWPANTYYTWHVDGFNRQASLNIPLIASDKCVTMFKTKKENSKFENLFQVPYIMYKPTILNVRQEHGVFNFSSQDRYVLNLSFNTVPYKVVIEYFKNLKVVNY